MIPILLPIPLFLSNVFYGQNVLYFWRDGICRLDSSLNSRDVFYGFVHSWNLDTPRLPRLPGIQVRIWGIQWYPGIQVSSPIEFLALRGSFFLDFAVKVMIERQELRRWAALWPQPLTMHKLVPWGCTKLSSCNVLEGRLGALFGRGLVVWERKPPWLHVWIFEYAQGDIVTLRIQL